MLDHEHAAQFRQPPPVCERCGSTTTIALHRQRRLALALLRPDRQPCHRTCCYLWLEHKAERADTRRHGDQPELALTSEWLRLRLRREHRDDIHGHAGWVGTDRRMQGCQLAHPVSTLSAVALTSLLQLVDGPAGSPVEYVIGGKSLAGDDRETVAQTLADDAMRVACGRAPALGWWRARRDGGPYNSPTRQSTVRSFASIAFGSPESPPDQHHLQGHVAELLWHRILQERSVCRDGRQLVRAHPVKADPLEPGGDGLVIYENCASVLVFRLWEIKKHESQALVSATINRASKQLRDRGPEYLAKLTGPETLAADGPLGDLYADLVELWIDRSYRAGVGVSVGTSDHHAPQLPSAFKSIRTAFPEFSESSQTESIVVAIPDFPGFAERVKDIVWSGL